MTVSAVIRKRAVFEAPTPVSPVVLPARDRGADLPAGSGEARRMHGAAREGRAPCGERLDRRGRAFAGSGDRLTPPGPQDPDERAERQVRDARDKPAAEHALRVEGEPLARRPHSELDERATHEPRETVDQRHRLRVPFRDPYVRHIRARDLEPRRAEPGHGAIEDETVREHAHGLRLDEPPVGRLHENATVPAQGHEVLPALHPLGAHGAGRE